MTLKAGDIVEWMGKYYEVHMLEPSITDPNHSHVFCDMFQEPDCYGQSRLIGRCGGRRYFTEVDPLYADFKKATKRSRHE